MARYIENLNECTDPTTSDYLLVYDDSAGATDKDRKVNISRFGILANTNAFTGQTSFSTTTGLTGTKATVAHNSATAICRLTVGGASALAASYLIAINLTSANTSSSVMYLLSQGYSTATIAEHAEALFGHSAVTVTATGDVANRRATLSLTQVNGSSEAVSIRVSVIPLCVWDNAAVTLTML